MHDYACELERSQQPSELKEAFRIFEQASLHGLCISHNKVIRRVCACVCDARCFACPGFADFRTECLLGLHVDV